MVSSWTHDISRIVKTKLDLKHASTIQEINFQLNYEKALQHIKQQKELKEVDLALRILSKSKQRILAMKFETDTNF